MLALPATRTPRFSPQAYPHFNKLIAFALLLLLILSWSNFSPISIPRAPSFHSSSTTNAIYNSTLGFEKIFALALKGREDRIKPLLRAAEATNLSLTVLTAVRDSEIDRDTWPEGWDENHHRTGELGCLISHLRTWNKMIATNTSSALILESDADWDMRIKQQFAPLAKGIKTIVDWPFDRALHKVDPLMLPYGDTWDIVWMGHCGSNHGGYGRIYSWNDSSVPPEDKEFIFDMGLDGTQHTPGTRTVFQFGRTTCSSAYAISLQGAIKLVQYFKQGNENLDIALSQTCSGRTDMICLGVWPQMITAAATKSNIDHSGNGDDTNGGGDVEEKVQGGPGLQFSARVNSRRVLEDGVGREGWKAEWETMWAEGHGGWVMVGLNRSIV